MPLIVGGFDFSLTSTGMVAMPADWDGNWSHVATTTAGESLPKTASVAEQLQRLRVIRHRMRCFVQRHRITVAVVEEYAFSAQASRAHALGELGGVCKVELTDMGCEVVVVSPARARTLLGRQPKSDRKAWAHAKLYAAGAPTAWGGDVLDAFACANYHLSETGGYALILPEAA